MTAMLHLIAHLGDRGIAVSTGQVDSVVDIRDVVPVPGAPDYIKGLVALRSRVATVIDTARVLGLPTSQAPGARAIITKVDGHLYALAVDRMDDVSDVTVEPVPPGLAVAQTWRRLATGLVNVGGEPILALDLERLIATLSDMR